MTGGYGRLQQERLGPRQCGNGDGGGPRPDYLFMDTVLARFCARDVVRTDQAHVPFGTYVCRTKRYIKESQQTTNQTNPRSLKHIHHDGTILPIFSASSRPNHGWRGWHLASLVVIIVVLSLAMALLNWSGVWRKIHGITPAANK